MAYDNSETLESAFSTDFETHAEPTQASINAEIKKTEAEIVGFLKSVDPKLLDIVTRLRNAKAKKSPQAVIEILEKELAALKPNAKLLRKIEQYEALRHKLSNLKKSGM